MEDDELLDFGDDTPVSGQRPDDDVKIAPPVARRPPARRKPKERQKVAAQAQRAQRKEKLKKLRTIAPPPGMSARAMIYCHGRISGLNKGDAAYAAGFSTSSHDWSSIEKNESVQTYIRNLAGQVGITPQMIMRKLAEGLDAMVVKDFCSKDGDLVSGPPRTDFPTRLEYAKTVITLAGMDPTKVDPVAANSTTNILILADSYKDTPIDELLHNVQRMQLGMLDPKDVVIHKREESKS